MTAGIIFLSISAMMDISTYARAEIIPEPNLPIISDTTLPNSSKVNLSDRDRTLLIQGGTEVGNNLFHSFSRFSLPNGYTAHFENHNQIQNIFSRITGKEASYIDGLLQANYGANLFIINPNGIVFGSNARLNIGGSFFASTANSINFDNGERFSVKPEDTTPLLTVNTPVGLQVGVNPEKNSAQEPSFKTPVSLQFGVNPGKIHVGESGFDPTLLQVESNQTLALIGGDVILENADISTLKSGGRIELGSVASEGRVNFTETNLGFIFNFDAVPNLGKMQILGSRVESLGDIQVTAKHLLFQDGIFKADNNLSINTTGNIKLLGYSSVHVTGLVRFPSHLTINTQNLLVQDSSTIGVDRGNLTINASNAVQMLSNGDTSLRNSSRIFATASEDVTQTAGNLTINTRNLSVQGGAQILTGSSLVGLPNEPRTFNARETVTRRNLTINASESVTLSGSSLDEVYPSGLFTTTFEGQDSGRLTINTKILSIEDGAQVATGNFYSGQVGNLTVNATEKVQIIGTSATGKIPPQQQINGVIDEPVLDTSLRVTTSVQGVRIQGTLPSGLFTNTPTTKEVGDININTRQLLVQDGGQISANTFGQVRGSNLNVNATEQVQLLGTATNGIPSGLLTRTNPQAKGEAGNLTILTGNLLVQDGAQVSASTFSASKGGNLTVQATEGIKLIGVSRQNAPSGLFAQANSGSTGDAGDLKVNTSTLIVRDGAQVSASTFGRGKGGNVTVQATENIELIGTFGNDELFPSGLFAVAAGTTGDAGNLIIDARNLLVRDGAQIGASTRSQGQGGNLTVNVKDRVQLMGTAVNGAFPSGLFATTAANSTGKAGNLTINTNLLQVSQGAGIAVQSRGQGSAGNLLVNARSMDLAQKAFISADTRSVDTNSNQPQANINLRSQDLILLRGNSSITTNARGSNVIGGNITIDTKLLAAFENSDISANSADFRGGKVKITAEGITGTQFRPVLTPESDITATGATPELSGSVEITTPAVDPSRGLTELPENVSDASNQIAQKCRANDALARQPNQFLITGKGGLPANPYDTLESESAIAGWINVNNINNIAKNDINYPKIINSPLNTIVEAQALTFDPNGNLVLIAEAPHPKPQTPALTHPVCTS